MAARVTRNAGIASLLDPLLFWKKKRRQSHVEKLGLSRSVSLTTEKQAELEMLCNQLFRKKELITSGKLQFIGLAKIKKHMGKRWGGLCKIVYDTAEEVINQHLEKGDLSIRYKDDTYVLIFSCATLEEGKFKAALIAEQIRQRLFALDNDELQDVEIRQMIVEIRTDLLIDKDLPDTLAVIAESKSVPQIPQETGCPQFKTLQVEPGPPPQPLAADCDQKTSAPFHDLACSYIPLWDTRKSAVATYVCLANDPGGDRDEFGYYQILCNQKTAAEKLALDRAMLDTVCAELIEMEKDNRRLLVGCPVQYDTLYHYESHQEYKKRLSQILPGHRQFLKLLIMNAPDTMLIKTPYWFVAPLREFCREVCLELPLLREINFQPLRDSGINIAGIRLHRCAGLSEYEIISILNCFSVRAKAMKISKTFVFGVSTLSVATSAVCAGFDFLGGSAIHESVAKPQHVYRYSHTDLLAGLM